MNPEKVIKNLVQKEFKTIENTNYTILKRIEDNFVIKDIYIDNDEKKLHFFEKVQLISLDKFNKILKKSNFTLIKTFGNYNLEDYGMNSDRLIIVAKKN